MMLTEFDITLFGVALVAPIVIALLGVWWWMK